MMWNESSSALAAMKWIKLSWFTMWKWMPSITAESLLYGWARQRSTSVCVSQLGLVNLNWHTHLPCFYLRQRSFNAGLVVVSYFSSSANEFSGCSHSPGPQFSGCSVILHSQIPQITLRTAIWLDPRLNLTFPSSISESEIITAEKLVISISLGRARAPKHLLFM